jgi:ElaB/YqjD/DUF883 family membrane-anchored ribosome-binding protein
MAVGDRRVAAGWQELPRALLSSNLRREVVMSTTTPTVNERLADVNRRSDKLQAKAQVGTAEAKTAIQRQVDKLRGDAAAVSKARGPAADEKLAQLEAKADVAEERAKSEVADKWDTFGKAAANALDRWDAYLERVDEQTWIKTDAASMRAGSAKTEVKQRRDAVAKSLADARAAQGDKWREQKKRVGAAFDKLDDSVGKAFD